MKILAGLILLLLATGCQQPAVNIAERTCYASGQAAKTLADVRQKLVGTWRLVELVGGFRQPNKNPTPVADIVLTFQANGQLVVTADGVRQIPLTYDVIIGPLPYDQANSGPQLLPSGPLELPGFGLNRATLYVCDSQLRLDYGTVVDGPAQEFDRLR